ncbi:hypothetical protein KOW79_018328 [Hemibagrus wyckioides]|uniref:Uncharacterized protein n=1 Tax=Hemibagrus wyckioides TaxID=337641 RepID=A0A9D3SGD5_9TELE|nr:hypothetical protein KOW79_018328 [Hemibagrus wyckioides]
MKRKSQSRRVLQSHGTDMKYPVVFNAGKALRGFINGWIAFLERLIATETQEEGKETGSGSNGSPLFKAMTKRKWEGRREGFRVNTTREETQGPGRPTSRGRFSESWKRLSSRQGSTKRSGLAAQQAAVRTGMASVCGSTGGWHGLAGGWQVDV